MRIEPEWFQWRVLEGFWAEVRVPGCEGRRFRA